MLAYLSRVCKIFLRCLEIVYKRTVRRWRQKIRTPLKVNKIEQKIMKIEPAEIEMVDMPTADELFNLVDDDVFIP